MQRRRRVIRPVGVRRLAIVGVCVVALGTVCPIEIGPTFTRVTTVSHGLL